MRIKLLYFSSIKDKIKRNSEDLELDKAITIGELKGILKEKYKEIAEILDKSMFAVNENYVSEDYQLKDGDTVAVIPPVSGG
jgi:molybdopterin synthase sulfur carrier subunit